MYSTPNNDSRQNQLSASTPKKELRFLKRSTLDVLNNINKVLELNNVELHQSGENIIQELFSQFFGHYAINEQTNMVNLWQILLSPHTNLPDQLVSIMTNKSTNLSKEEFNTVKSLNDCIFIGKVRLIALEVMTSKLPDFAPAIIRQIDILYRNISRTMVWKILGKHPRYDYPITLKGTVSLVKNHISEMSNEIVNLIEMINLEYDANSVTFPYNDVILDINLNYILERLCPTNQSSKNSFGDFPKIVCLLRALSKYSYTVGVKHPQSMIDRTNHVFSIEQWPVFLQHHREICRLMRCLTFNNVDSIAWLSELLYYPTCHIKLDYDQFANAKHYTSNTFTQLLNALDNFAIILYRVIIKIFTEPADRRVSGETTIYKRLLVAPGPPAPPAPPGPPPPPPPAPPAPPGGGPSVPPGPSGVFPGAGTSMPPAPPGPPGMFPGAGMPSAPSSTPGIPTSGVGLPS